MKLYFEIPHNAHGYANDLKQEYFLNIYATKGKGTLVSQIMFTEKKISRDRWLENNQLHHPYLLQSKK